MPMRVAFAAFTLAAGIFAGPEWAAYAGDPHAGPRVPGYTGDRGPGLQPRHDGGPEGRPSDQQTGVVAGRVMDATSNRPMPGAVVTLVSGAPAPPPLPGAPPPRPTPPPPGGAQPRRAVAVANGDGRFVFRDVPPGPYTLTTALGFGAYSPGAYGRRRPNGPSRALNVEAGARVNDVVIHMWRNAVIAGTLRDDRGEPVVGVGVWALRRVMANGRYELMFDGGTVEASDDRGRFRLTGLLPGSYLVCARSATQTVAVETAKAFQAAVTSGTSGEMRRGWIETGGVWPQGGGVVSGEWMAAGSSAEIQPLPGPNGTVLVQAPSCAPGASSARDARVISLAAGDERDAVDLTLPLVPGVRVSGVLMRPTGPAPSSGLLLYEAGAADELRHEIPLGYSISDSSGRFAFLGVTPGSYVVRAYRVTPTGPLEGPVPAAAGVPGGMTRERLEPGPPKPSMFGEAPVTVGAGNIDGLTVTYEQGARVSGRVVFDGATAAPTGAQLQAVAIAIRPIDRPVSGMVSDTRVSAEGLFTTAGFPAGRHIVTGIRPPGPQWVLSSITIGGADATGRAFTLGGRDLDGAVITFTDRRMSISGVVRPAGTGSSPEATVVLFPANTQEWFSSGMSTMRVASVASEPDGSYRLDVPLAGDYIVVAVPPEINPAVDGEFIARWAASGVKLSFAPGETKTQALTLGRAK